MTHFKAAFTAGIAMFAMFFGSGNLVIPIIIGMDSTNNFLIASTGLLLTGVIMPFVGLFSMVLYRGNKEKFFGLLGKYAPFALSLLILSLIGPFGVVPRCILVSYGGINLIFPNLPLSVFSAFFLALVCLIIWKKDKIVDIIGKFLGPIKIVALILIIIAAIWQSPELTHSEENTNFFKMGLIQGYQTMDLMAGFFFSIAIVQYLQVVCKNKQETLKVAFMASCVGAFFIAVIYIGLVSLGAYYAPSLVGLNKEQLLAKIANLTLGKEATYIVSFTIFFSCLVTGATLVRLFSQFLNEDVFKKKLSWNKSIFISILISYVLSLTGFDNIVIFLHSILSYAYPALISLTLTSILNYFYGFNRIKELFWVIVISTIVLNNV